MSDLDSAKLQSAALGYTFYLYTIPGTCVYVSMVEKVEGREREREREISTY